MSSNKAILFWSKREAKSIRMKKIIETLGADIQMISVDSSQVREMLLNDDRFSINQVPTVLILNSTGNHQVLTNSTLEYWFAELIENIKQYHQQQQQQPQIEQTILDDEPEEPLQNVPKELRRSLIDEDNIPNRTLPSPGKPAVETPMQQSLTRQHIKQEPITAQVTKTIKKEGISPSEIAKQMADQRKELDESEEQNRPFN